MTSKMPFRERDNADFELLVEESGLTDRGIREFNHAFTHLQAMIRANDEKDQARLFRNARCEFNDRWPFHGEKVVFSGKLYLCDLETIHQLDAELITALGEPQEDGYGEYYNVSDLPLLSRGITYTEVERAETDPQSDECEFETIFVYAYNTDDSDMPTFYSIPEQLNFTRYPMPTSVAIEAEFNRAHPELKQRIDTELNAGEGDYEKIVIILRDLTDILNTLSAADRELAALYVSDRLNFDTEWPAVTELHGVGRYIHEFEDDDGDSTETLVSTEFRETLPMMRMPLKIGIYTTDDGHSEWSVWFADPMVQDSIENASTYIEVPCSSIAEMVSVRELASRERIRRALADLALNKKIDELGMLDEMADEEQAIEVEVPTEDEVAARYAELLAICASKIEAVKKTTFNSREAAITAADTLSRELDELLDISDFDHLPVVAESPGVYIINADTDIASHEDGSVIMSVQRRSAEPVREMSVEGPAYGKLQAVAVSIEDLPDQKYSISADFIVKLTDTRMHMLYHEGILLHQMSESRWCIVDPTEASIEPVHLANKKAREHSIKQFSEKYPDSPAIVLLTSLSEALSDMPTRGRIELDNPDVLSTIATANQDNATETDDALDTLKASFDHRFVMLEGDIYPDKSHQRLAGVIIDFLPSVPHLDIIEPAMVLSYTNTDHDSDVYVPLSTITRLSIG